MPLPPSFQEGTCRSLSISIVKDRGKRLARQRVRGSGLSEEMYAAISSAPRHLISKFMRGRESRDGDHDPLAADSSFDADQGGSAAMSDIFVFL
jgi:hypothetical protein